MGRFVGLIAAAMVFALPAPAGAAAPNPIQAENALTGAPVGAVQRGPIGVIDGYASEVSALPGDTLHFHVSTAAGAKYRVEVYRLGYYGGMGARLIGCTPGCVSSEPGQQFAVPTPDSNGLVRASWPVTDTFTLPRNATSGYYRIRFVLLDGRFSTTFVIVKAPASANPSAILVQVPVDTWQAYNWWGGRSLYNQKGLSQQANRVSFDRPYAGTGIGWEYPLVLFLEKRGYDVSYQTDEDTDANPSSLLSHKLVIVAGHSEYWTSGMRNAFDAARDAGVNLAFMGANAAYWQVRYESAGRVIVSYKSATADPVTDPSLQTVLFRALNEPECQLIGIQHQGGELNWPVGDYQIVPSSLSNPWFAGTGFDGSSVLRGLVSVETDTIPGTQTASSSCGNALTVFFQHDGGGDEEGNADVTAYTAPSGAVVFAAGSHQFVWGLADGSSMTGTGGGLVDPRLQQFVANMLNDLSVTHVADLGVQLSPLGRQQRSGRVRVAAVLTNSGPDDVRAATLQLSLPPGASFVRVAGKGLRCSRSPVQCVITSFAAGTSIRAVFTLHSHVRASDISARLYAPDVTESDPAAAEADVTVSTD